MGYSPQEVIGKTPFDLMPPDEAKKVKEVFQEIAIQKKSFSAIENWNAHKNGGLVLLETSGIPILDKKGSLIGYRGIDRDITERKKAEDALRESEQRFKLVAEAANVMVYETDVVSGKAKIIRGSQEVVGYDTDEVNFTVEWVLSHIHPDDYQKVFAQFKNAIEKGENYSIEYRFRHKNGNYIIVKDTAKVVRDETGKTVRFIGGIRDITKRKETEERIEQYNRQLEKLVEQRTKQLIDYERFAAIGQVAGMVGHDIRNPLQAIVSSAFLVREQLNEMPDCMGKNNIKEELSYIEEQLTYIDKIVKDLQDYSKPLSPEFSEVDVYSLTISALATIFVPDNVEASVEIEEAASMLFLDPMFFRRIIVNLITNAIQAMPDGGYLTVKGQKRKMWR